MISQWGKEDLGRSAYCGGFVDRMNRVTEGVEDIESCWDAWEGDELWDVS